MDKLSTNNKHLNNKKQEQFFGKILNVFFKDLFLPKFCFGCGYIGAYICPNCQKKLKKNKDTNCLYCGKKSAGGLTHPACCRPGGVDGYIGPYHYDNLLKKIIKNIKYRGVKTALDELIMTIDYEVAAKIKRLPVKKIYILPIPLHKSRKLERGFNQAEPVALFLRDLISQPIDDCLIRTRPTLAQAQITNKNKRLKNTENAFSITKPVRGKNFLIVDDVITSGATVMSVAKTLKENGAEKVFVFTLAKG